MSEDTNESDTTIFILQCEYTYYIANHYDLVRFKTFRSLNGHRKPSKCEAETVRYK